MCCSVLSTAASNELVLSTCTAWAVVHGLAGDPRADLSKSSYIAHQPQPLHGAKGLHFSAFQLNIADDVPDVFVCFECVEDIILHFS